MISPAFNVYKVAVNVVGLRDLKYLRSVCSVSPLRLTGTNHEEGGEAEEEESDAGHTRYYSVLLWR